VQTSSGYFKHLSNRYFEYYFDGTTTNSVLYLHYAATPSGTPYDLDFYVYYDQYIFQDTSTMAGVSDNYYPEPGGVETINLSGKPAGTYMINVSVYMSSGAAQASTRFYIQTNSGKYLCP
jgi:hypothetical protein